MQIARLFLLALITLLVSCQEGSAPPQGCTDPIAATSVELADFAFRPSCVSADAGETIALENTGESPHTFTVTGTDVDLNVDAGTSVEARLSMGPGTYAVSCTYHPQMEATLTVA
jgi:plastocyanin